MERSTIEVSGSGERTGIYSVPDGQLAVGSTLGGPKACAMIKATGALEKVYAIDAGEELFGTLVLHHWDARTGIRLTPLPGVFTIHPSYQEHTFTLSNGIAVHETIFVLSGTPKGDDVDPPAVYYQVELRNDGSEEVQLDTYAFCELRGLMEHDVVATYDPQRHAFLAWNKGKNPDHVRAFGLSVAPTSYETTLDHAKAISDRSPGMLSGKTDTPPSDPLGVFHVNRTLQPSESANVWFTLSFSMNGREGAQRMYTSCPNVQDALTATKAYYTEILSRSVLMTPDPEINRGVLWAKANMLRTLLKAPTGWSFVNDPTRSNNSVGRDTAWFGFGGDYLVPDFVRESLLAYVENQEPSGMVVEYYDVRSGKTADYGLNINDNTPLLILALWHHYNATGDDGFLARVYPAAVKAARYILSQRNDQGLVWCTATRTSDWGIIGWRNVIQNYRLSGATTEVNSECFAALQTIAQMARVLKHHEQSAEFSECADELRTAINAHLLNPYNGLYYLNIDVDGEPRSDVTSDLVFPVMFGVASDETAARIIARLSGDDFWTEGGFARFLAMRRITGRSMATVCSAASGSPRHSGMRSLQPGLTRNSWPTR